MGSAVELEDVTLATELAGEGTALVGLHGLTATRRYVLLGSRALERNGHRVILYDARGHGASGAPRSGRYGYPELAGDLLGVLDAFAVERAVLVGHSMGAHTALRAALVAPQRVAALALLTPAFDPRHFPEQLERWDALSRGLREGGIDGFLAAYPLARLPERWRATVEKVIRQRLAAHADPLAVAAALSAVPRSAPFESFAQLASLAVPTVVVGSRDSADPDHPLATARAYAEAIPHARLLVEAEGEAPLAWQGGRLSRILMELSERAR